MLSQTMDIRSSKRLMGYLLLPRRMRSWLWQWIPKWMQCTTWEQPSRGLGLRWSLLNRHLLRDLRFIFANRMFTELHQPLGAPGYFQQHVPTPWKRAMRFRLRQWGVTNPASLLRNKTWDEPVQRFEKSLQSLQPMRQRMRRSFGHTLWLRSTWNYGTTWPNECASDQSSQNQPPTIRRFAGPQPT